MSVPRFCPDCAAPLTPDAPPGSCPRCVLQGALDLAGTGAELTSAEQLGDRIGRYQLMERIGEGGCGIVYRAEQTEPLQRQVALKIVKLGMDTRRVIARFEGERQALALMDHPNIARVIDAGASDLGRPFFVMELVAGTRITDYCDQHQLGPNERLDLFIQVCRAVQHAHQKGIIHLDLKPSNILVCQQDGLAVPKVIDFGIAKATQQTSLHAKVSTALPQFIGTPAYMSPEQAGMNRADVDTRSDIYALGVLLYELLTGQTPFAEAELTQHGFDRMRRLIQETEPPNPSTRLRELPAAEAVLVASKRDTAFARLVQSVRGDLDWIVMKCLEKDRRRRYETANELARDVERHLHHEPVTAAAPAAFYRVRKLVRRHRVGLATAAALAALLVAGVVASTWQAVRATQAEHEQSRLRREAEKARQDAEEQKRHVEAAWQDAQRQQQRAQVSLAEAERQRAAKETALQESQEQRAKAVAALHEVQEQRAVAESALRRASNAWSMAEVALKELREEQNRLEEAMDFMLFDLSDKLRPIGRVDLLRTVTERVLAHYQSLPQEESESSQSRRFLAYQNLGEVLALQGDSSKAVEAYRAALAIAAKRSPAGRLGAESLVGLATCHERIGAICLARGQYDEALAAFNTSLDIGRRLAASAPRDAEGQLRLVAGHLSVGDVLWALADQPKAKAAYEAALEIANSLVNANPQNALGQRSLCATYTRLAALWIEESAFDRALHMARASLDIAQRFAAAAPTDTAWQSDLALSHDALAEVWLARQEPKKALGHYQEALKIRQHLAEADPTDTAWQRGLLQSHGNVGRALAYEGRKSKTLEVFVESMKLVVDSPRKHLLLAHRLFSLDHRANRPLEAFRESIKVARQLADTDPGNLQWQNDLARCHSFLGDLLLQAGEKENALQEYRNALQIRQQLVAGEKSPSHFECALAVAHADVALALRRLSRHDEALSEARHTLDLVGTLASRWPGNPVLLTSARARGRIHRASLPIRSDQQDAVAAAFRRGFAAAKNSAAKEFNSIARQEDWARYCSEMAVIGLFLDEIPSAVEHAENALDIWGRLARLAPTNAVYQARSGKAALVLATLQLVGRQAQLAIETSRHALALDPFSIEARALLAMGYLLDSQEAPARALLLENKHLQVGATETFAAAVLDDVRRLRHEGEPCSDLDRIEQILQQPSQQ